MKETSSADQTEDRDAMKKKKEVHKALLVASKKEVQVHIAPTLEYVRSGAQTT